MDVNVNDVLHSRSSGEYTKVLEVDDGGRYGLTGWTKSQEKAEEAEKISTFVNKFGLRNANAEVVGSVDGDQVDEDETEEADTDEAEADEEAESSENVDLEAVSEMTKTEVRDHSADWVRAVADELDLDTEKNKGELVDAIADELDL